MRKVILYGIGAYYNYYKKYLPKDIEIIAYADSNIEKSTANSGNKFENVVIVSPQEILDLDYDCIIISTYIENAYEITILLNSLGIDLKKVEYLYRYFACKDWTSCLDEDYNFIHTIRNISLRERKNNSSDGEVIYDLFCNNPYNIDIKYSDTVVIDIGMNIGVASLMFASNINVKKVYSYEPFPDTYEAGVYNLSLNECGNKVISIKAAMYNYDGLTEVPVLYEYAAGRSTEIGMIKENNRAEKCRKVMIQYLSASKEIRRIYNNNPESHFIMKIDVEGAEFEIFESLKNTDLLLNLDAIIIEYHRNPNEILNQLRESGFCCIVTGKLETVGMIYAIKTVL